MTAVLLDNFSGSGALTAHTPDTYPVGSAWSIISGSFGDLSGGYLPYGSGSNGRAIIDSGLADCEMLVRFKHHNVASNGSGAILRANAAGSDYYYLGSYVDTDDIIYWNLPNSITLDPTQPSAQKAIRSLTPGDYYTWRIVLKGAIARLYDESDVLTLAAAGIAKLTQTYFGVGCHQPYGSWDSIQVSPISKPLMTFSVIGDSISNDYTDWPGIVGAKYNNGYCYALHNAQPGAGIADHMDEYTDDSEADNADLTLILLGTNDSHSYDPTAEYQENLQELFATLGKPIYCMGILPTTTWTDGERNTFNGLIEDAVDNAVAAGVNATYWSTDGWIDPATDTSDGLHPTAAGHIKIADEILALMPGIGFSTNTLADVGLSAAGGVLVNGGMSASLADVGTSLAGGVLIRGRLRAG